MAWTSLSFAYGSTLTSAKMTQMYNNFAAMAAGSASAPALTAANAAFGSGAAAVTQAVGNNTTRIATTAYCMAGFVNNDVGVEGIGTIILANKTSSGTLASGATIAGSSLEPLWFYLGNPTLSGVALSGTWRLVLNADLTDVTAGDNTAPFQRIS